MDAEITSRLRAPIPQQLVRQINGHDYISGQTAIDRLIQATGNDWSFDIGQVVHSPGHVAMQGELTIGGQTRSAWGEAKATKNPNEELFKTCETDTIKRCARLFGVALALYGDLLDEQTGEMTQRPHSAP
ncbi:MAG: RAD52 family DNA repair protein, partial [Chloroflexota bacterium]|nr:RAD52 family DNA repair protein [Chloroflexota bacterium]